MSRRQLRHRLRETLSEYRARKHRSKNRRRTTSASSMRYEMLEDRLVLATLFWQGDTDNTWSDATNWNTMQDGTGADQAPANNDVLVFDTNTTGITSFTPNNDVAGLTGIEIQVVDDSGANNFTLGGAQTVGLGASGVSNSGTDSGLTTINTNLALGAAATISNTSSGGDLDINGTIDNDGNLLSANGGTGASATTFDGIVSGAGGLTALSGNTFLRANNTYGGTTTVASSARLQPTVDGALGNVASPTVVQSGGTLVLGGFNYAALEPITLDGGTLRAEGNAESTIAGPITLTADSFITSDGLANSGFDLTGAIGGGSGLTVSDGMVKLSAANTYTGATTVNGGNLLVNGSTVAASTIDVNNGATLGGTGNVQGAVNVNSGGTLSDTLDVDGAVDVKSGGTISPGTSPGIIMTGNLNLMDGSTLAQEINMPGNTAGTDYDQIDVTGTVTIGDLTIDLSGDEVPPAGFKEYIIIDNDGVDPVVLGAGAPAPGAVVGTLNGIDLRINYEAGTGNDVALFVGQTFELIDANDLAPGTAGDGTPDVFELKINGNDIEVTINGVAIAPLNLATTGSIGIRGSVDDDTLIVNTDGGLFEAPIAFDGDGNSLGEDMYERGVFPPGPGFDTLKIVGDAQVTTVEQIVGPDPTNGRLIYDSGAMTIDYTALEPIEDDLVAAELIVNGNNAANAINYMVGSGDGTVTAAVNASMFIDVALIGAPIQPVVGDTVTFTTGAAAGETREVTAFDAVTGQVDVDAPFGAAPAVGDVYTFVSTSSGLVSVDEFETMQFLNKTALTINGQAGSDEINLNNPHVPTALTTITVNGDDPTASDKAIVNAFGTNGNVVNVEVTGMGAATLTGTGLTSTGVAFSIALDTIETLVVDGDNSPDIDLTVAGAASNANRFLHTPSAAFDAGSVLVSDAFDGGGVDSGTLLNVEYQNLGMEGTVTVDGVDGTDSLIALGTELSEEINIDFTATDAIDIDVGLHIDLRSANVDNYQLHALAGDDRIVVRALIDIDDGDTFAIFGGNPDNGSDVLELLGADATIETVTIAPDGTNPTEQDVTGLGERIDVAGIELITYSGADTDDTLTVNPGSGDNEVRVEAAANGNFDRVTSDSLPAIEFTGLDTFQINANSAVDSGADVVTFKTRNLAGAEAANYEMRGDIEDVLVIEGVAGALSGDSYTITQPLDSETVVTDNNSNVVVTALLGPAGTLGALHVNTLGGDDAVTVDVGSIDLVATPIVYDGGSGADLLTVSGTPATAVTHVAYTPGAEITSGRLSYNTAAAQDAMSIEFTGLEPVVDLVPAEILTVNGTNADNAINYMQTPGEAVPLRGRVTVDGFELIDFSNKTNLVIDAMAGDDVISLNNSSVPDDLTSITVNGNDPTASDKVIVNADGNGGNDVRVVVDNLGSAMLTGTGLTSSGAALSINLGTIEALVVDGGNSPDIDLTVAGPDNDGTRFLHTPGAAYDAGSVLVSEAFDGGVADSGALLTVHYENLGQEGTVTVDGVSETDSLIALGTELSEQINIDFTATDAIDIDVGLHIDLRSTNVDNYQIHALAGDDLITVQAPVDIDFAEGDTFRVFGGSPDAGSDVLELLGAAATAETVTVAPDSANPTEQDVTGLGAPIDVAGIELITYTGADDDDTLTVDPGQGDNNVRVERGSQIGGASADRVLSDSLPEIQFVGLDTFVVDAVGGGNSGADIVTFKTGQLTGADNLNYQMIGDATDTLMIEGADGAALADDSFAIRKPAGASSIRVRDLNGPSNVRVEETSGNLGRFQLNTLGGDDFIDVDTNNDDVIGVPITIDGGGGSDLLSITGDPTTAVDEVIYTPGPAVTEGRLLYEDAGDSRLMSIDFIGLEPVVDTLVAVNLTVHGTPSANTIDFSAASATRGLVTVDDFESIEFDNKTNLTIDAGAGADAINLDPNGNTPTALATIVVEGDQGDDVVTLANLVDSTTLTLVTVNAGTGNDTVDGSLVLGLAAVPLSLSGDLGDDTLLGGDANDTLAGGPGDDFLVGNSGNNTYTEAAAAGFDTIGILGTPADDVIDVNQTNANTLVSTVNGDTRTDSITTAATIEAVRIEAGHGDDLIRVEHNDGLVAAPQNSIRMEVVGDDPNASDRLVVMDDGLGDVVIYRKGNDDRSGKISVGPLAPVVFESTEYVDILPLNDSTAGTGADGNGRLVVFKHDPFENNNARLIANWMGAGTTINVDPTIDPGGLLDPFGDGTDLPGDVDWYEFEAGVTGTLDFQVLFRQVGTLANGRPGLPGNGDLDIQVTDDAGNFIGGFGTNDTNDDERVRIPVVEGQRYFLRVSGRFVDSINNYSITVINDPLPVPYDIELRDIIAISTVTSGPVGQTFDANSANLVQDVDFYNDKFLYFTSGALVGQRVLIADYDGVNTFTVAAGFDLTGLSIGDDFQIESHDTGRSQFDDITRDASPEIILRLDDDILLEDLPGNPIPDSPPDEVIDIPFNPSIDPNNTDPGYRVAVFIEGDPQQPGQDPQILIGFAEKNPAVDGVYFFDFEDALNGAGLTLTDGSHFISAKVQIIDPAFSTQSGFGARSQSLEIVVDTTPPPVFFGTPGDADDGIDPAETDTGVEGYPDTFVDRVTSDTATGFTGTAEADSVVRLYADQNGNGMVDDGDTFLGLTVAVPNDGTNQFPNGQWNMTPIHDLNDPNFFPFDGLRQLLVTAEDPAGNVSEASQLEIFIDTQGPQVTRVFIPGDEDFNLWDVKDLDNPDEDGDRPTPRATTLSIDFQDLPDRIVNFLYDALQEEVALEPGHYTLIGDHVGAIAIIDVDISQQSLNGQPATATVDLEFADPLPDDRYTLTISDSLVDPAGNNLDGETNLIGPVGSFNPPSGDGVPGGDFVARFTVDSRPEIGVWATAGAFLDINQNFIFDPDGPSTDETNRDFVFQFGTISDALFAGNFATGEQNQPGYDKIGAYGFDSSTGNYRFLLDTTNDGVANVTVVSTFQVNAYPVAGRFHDDSDNTRDLIGIFDGSTWYLDTTGNNVLNDVIPSEQVGRPIVGDFNGDGEDDLGAFDPATNQFTFDLDRDGDIDDSFFFGFNGFREWPVAGDINLDGIDDIGLFVPRGDSQLTGEDVSEWYILVSDKDREPNGEHEEEYEDEYDWEPSELFSNGIPGAPPNFSPAPLHNDIFAQYGDQLALPLFGNFDPPVGSSSGEPGESSAFAQNDDDQYDVNDDGNVNLADLMLIVDALNSSDPAAFVENMGDGYYFDVNGDEGLGPQDAIMLVNLFNGSASASASASAAPSVQSAVLSESAVVDVVSDDLVVTVQESPARHVAVATDWDVPHRTNGSTWLDSAAADVVAESAIDLLLIAAESQQAGQLVTVEGTVAEIGGRQAVARDLLFSRFELELDDDLAEIAESISKEWWQS